MDAKSVNRQLFSFLKKSPTPYHATETIRLALVEAGFQAVDERKKWTVNPGQPYYLVRDDGSIIAFNIGKKSTDGFRILGSHTDSPCLQIKPNCDIFEKSYHKIGVEVYGGALLNPWFDRELSIAGRVTFVAEDNKIHRQLVDFSQPVAVIPSVAIHLDRSANKEKTINQQKDVYPLIGLGNSPRAGLEKYVKKHIKRHFDRARITEILGYDLFLYDYHTPCYTGIDKEFILSSRLDNLLSCFVILTAIRSANTEHSYMMVCNNHEEVGSNTLAGAQGNLLPSLFERLIPDSQRRHQTLANSFFISIDNAHATHPNHPDKHDSAHDILLNEGPVIKINANQRYTSNSRSSAIFKFLCGEAKVPYQEFVMRNDMPCGSTIGPMTSAKLGIESIDIGAPSLAMHSIRELTGSKDPSLMLRVVRHFLERETLPVCST